MQQFANNTETHKLKTDCGAAINVCSELVTPQKHMLFSTQLNLNEKIARWIKLGLKIMIKAVVFPAEMCLLSQCQTPL